MTKELIFNIFNAKIGTCPPELPSHLVEWKAIGMRSSRSSNVLDTGKADD
jgi:hypothetical protein